MTSFHACKADGSPIGEFTEPDFREKIFASEIAPEDFYWREGMADWKPVSEYRAGAKTTVIVQTPRHTEAATATARAQNTALKKLKRSPLPIFVVGFAGLMLVGFLANQCEKSGADGGTSRGAPHVRVGASDFVLRVTNEGTEKWNVMVVYINGQPPFTYKWEGPAPVIGKSGYYTANRICQRKWRTL